MRELLVCSAPGARQALLGLVHGGKPPVGEAFVDDDCPHAPTRDPLASAVVLVVASTDRDSLAA